MHNKHRIKQADIVDILNHTECASAGHVVGWTLSGGPWPMEEAHAAASAVGLDAELSDAWPRVTPRQAYLRAVRHAFSGTHATREYEIVLVRDDADVLAHAVVRRSVVDAEHLTFRRDVVARSELRVAFDKVAARAPGAPLAALFRTDGPEDDPLVQRLRSEYEALATRYLHDDVRKAFQRAFARWGGVRFQGSGGTWWIPPSADDLVARWAALLARLGCATLLLPIRHTAEAIASLRALTEDNLQGQLQAVFDDLRRFADGARTKASTLEARVATFDDLRARAELYERLLGHNLAEIRGRIATARDALVAALATRGGTP